MNTPQRKGVTDKGATFHVRIHFRQNADWQGTVQWLDGKKTATFRSTLELAKLMADALGRDCAGESGAQSWQNKEEVS
ncbi:MAG: hypothetical protein GX044_03140 [Firmicutes bacterium]|jgi:hypothetical protein|nr:hypothetical protein [Bacillota bacterium]